MKISVGEKSITPVGEFFPCFLMGHAVRTEKATGILDDIFVKVMSLMVNNEKLLYITIDLIGLERKVSSEMIDKISKKHQIKRENIIITFSHSHSTPEYSLKSFFSDRPNHQAEKYMRWIILQVYSTVDEIFNKKHVAVDVFYTTQEIKGYYSNRNGIDKTSDKEVSVLKFDSKERKTLASITVFSCHPTVLGPQNLEVSADLYGYLRKKAEENLGGVGFAQLGAAGDMSNRLYREGNDSAELIRVGDCISGQIYEKEGIWEKLNISSLKVSTYIFEESYVVDVNAKRKQLETINFRIKNAKSFDEKKVYSSAKAGLETRLMSNYSTFDLYLDCRYIEMGDLSIFTMPAELFAQFGLEIKNALGTKCSIFAGYTFYNASYLYNKEDQGLSFESVASDFPAGTTEKIVREVIEFIS